VLSVTRQRLATAIRVLRDELEIFEQAARPLQRLEELAVDLAAIDREISELKAEHQVRLGNWLAGGQVDGERPMASLRISLLEPRQRVLVRDVEAAGCP